MTLKFFITISLSVNHWVLMLWHTVVKDILYAAHKSIKNTDCYQLSCWFSLKGKGRRELQDYCYSCAHYCGYRNRNIEISRLDWIGLDWIGLETAAGEHFETNAKFRWASSPLSTRLSVLYLYSAVLNTTPSKASSALGQDEKLVVLFSCTFILVTGNWWLSVHLCIWKWDLEMHILFAFFDRTLKDFHLLFSLRGTCLHQGKEDWTAVWCLM